MLAKGSMDLVTWGLGSVVGTMVEQVGLKLSGHEKTGNRVRSMRIWDVM